jgi:hypothetical protein
MKPSSAGKELPTHASRRDRRVSVVSPSYHRRIIRVRRAVLSIFSMTFFTPCIAPIPHLKRSSAEKLAKTVPARLPKELVSDHQRRYIRNEHEEKRGVA